MRLKRASWTLAAVLLLILGGAVFSSCRTGDVGLVDGRLRGCPVTPNCVCSETVEGSQHIEPLGFSGDPDRAFGSLVEFLRAEPRVEIATLDEEYLHAVFRSRVFRFRDDVEFRLDREAGAIQVRSASRLGFSDLGANRARIESVRRRWKPAS